MGLETEVIRPEHDLAALRTLLDRHAASIDYIVGSVHHAGCVPIDFDRQTYERAIEACAGETRRLQLDYFDAQHRLLLALQPEIIGHFDLCRIWQPEARLNEDEEVWAAVRRNVEAAIEYGALFEINAAAFRKGWSTAYPGEEVLRVHLLAPPYDRIDNTIAQLILDLGGKLCLSDDSHGPQAVGNHYKAARDYLERMGVDELYFLAPLSSSEGNVGRRQTEVRRVKGDWRNLPFWGTAK